MIRCIFPRILTGMSNEGITINHISDVIKKSPASVRKKLSGNIPFSIDEAIEINAKLFPDVSFKNLFAKYEHTNQSIIDKSGKAS